jgi:hypothetical protein
VRAPDLNDVVERGALGPQLVMQVLQTGDGGLQELRDRRDVHHRRERIVARLALVHVIVGVDHLGTQLQQVEEKAIYIAVSGAKNQESESE